MRPNVRLTEGLTREIDWPANEFFGAEVPGAEGDLVVLEGTEPSLRWRRFTEAVVASAQELGVRMVITLGALLADVPHSRPVSVSGFASDQSMVGGLGVERTRYEGPTGIVGVLQHTCAAAGMPAASLWATGAALRGRVPQPQGGAGAGARLRGRGRGGRGRR